MTQAICEYRAAKGIDGPLYLGMDTHALSRRPRSARRSRCWPPTASSVCSQRDDGVTPTPVDLPRDPRLQPRARATASPTASSSRRRTTRRRTAASSTTRPTAGPPTCDVTERRSRTARTRCSRRATRGVKRHPLRARRQGARPRTSTTSSRPYVDDLRRVVDMDAIRAAGLRIGVDPLGGASVAYWEPIAERYGLDITVVNPKVDPTFAFMTRRPRRQDPHGLLEPLRDGEPDRAEGPLRSRVRQRRRRRPPRHRHAVGRA